MLNLPGSYSRTEEEMVIISAHVERIAAQRRALIEDIGATLAGTLGDSPIVSRRYHDLKIYIHVKITGIEDLLHHDWETVCGVAQRDVYAPLAKKFYDCARLE